MLCYQIARQVDIHRGQALQRKKEDEGLTRVQEFT